MVRLSSEQTAENRLKALTALYNATKTTWVNQTTTGIYDIVKSNGVSPEVISALKLKKVLESRRDPVDGVEVRWNPSVQLATVVQKLGDYLYDYRKALLAEKPPRLKGEETHRVERRTLRAETLQKYKDAVSAIFRSCQDWKKISVTEILTDYGVIPQVGSALFQANILEVGEGNRNTRLTRWSPKWTLNKVLVELPDIMKQYYDAAKSRREEKESKIKKKPQLTGQTYVHPSQLEQIKDEPGAQRLSRIYGSMTDFPEPEEAADRYSVKDESSPVHPRPMTEDEQVTLDLIYETMIGIESQLRQLREEGITIKLKLPLTL